MFPALERVPPQASCWRWSKGQSTTAHTSRWPEIRTPGIGTMNSDQSSYALANLPGMRPVQGREFCYIQNPDLKSFQSLFPKIVRIGGKGLPQSGGMLEENTIVTTPDGKRFFALSYKGDVESWRANIRACCDGLGLLWAEVQSSDLSLSNGEMISLSSCKVQTY
jgi:hypothetical protein